MMPNIEENIFMTPHGFQQIAHLLKETLKPHVDSSQFDIFIFIQL
jgi:hypothetical protein